MSEEEKLSQEEITTAREERRLELQQRFNPQRMKVVRKELFANLRDPAVTIRDGNITFNTACINGLEDVIWVNLMIDEEAGLLAVQECDENDKHALRWCIAKPDKRKSRKMTCPGFTDLLYSMMNWDKKCRYKILGYQIEFEGKPLYITHNYFLVRRFGLKTMVPGLALQTVLFCVLSLITALIVKWMSEQINSRLLMKADGK